MSEFQKTVSKSKGSPKAPEMSLFVQDMLEQMNSKFATMGDKILSRMDEMNARMDELELSIGELMSQAGLEQTVDSPRSMDSSQRSATRASSTPNNMMINI